MTDNISPVHPPSDSVHIPAPAENDAPVHFAPESAANPTESPDEMPVSHGEAADAPASPMSEGSDQPTDEPASEAAEDTIAEEDLAAPEGDSLGHAKHWYVVKVQSGREDSIKEAIERRVRKEGLEESFGQIVIPVEKVTEVKVDKNGKRVAKTRERKLYPGYLMVEVEYNDKIVYLFRETSGVGDFVGAHPNDLTKAPTPMSEREVQRMLGPTHGAAPEGGKESAPLAPKPKWLQEGDRVKVVDGTFNGMDGVVKQILEAQSKVQVELSIFGRPVAIELEYYQVEQL